MVTELSRPISGPPLTELEHRKLMARRAIQAIKEAMRAGVYFECDPGSDFDTLTIRGVDDDPGEWEGETYLVSLKR